MKNKLYTCALCLALMLSGSCSLTPVKEQEITFTLDDALVKLGAALERLNDTTLNPRTLEDGNVRFVPSRDWTSGFFPGILWMAYEYSGDTSWLESADHYSMNIEQEQYNGSTHDMGFKMYCSFGQGYRLTRNPLYRDILLRSANTLITRYHPVVGCIRSWDHNSDRWDYPVIIDNMMNLELLFWATRVTRDSSYYDIALRHAETTMKNHFREDGSSFHVLSYDTLTGEVVKRNTHQGYAHGSAWSRGQAWGLYGFTMTYRETGDHRFLDHARTIADFLLGHPNLPDDKVPYWDFDAPGQPDIYRDASAAAVMASALIELSTHLPGEGSAYVEAADLILSALSSNYRIKTDDAVPFLLDHSVGHLPGESEVDVPIIYADYYYLEALLRKMKLSGSWEGRKAKVIIKVDDLRYNPETVVSERWGRFVDYMEKEQIPASIGLIGESLEKGGSAYSDWIVQKHETGLFEFWNHGYDHSKGAAAGSTQWEFRNRSKSDQARHLQKAQELAREHLGFDLVTFGAPYNQSDQITAEVLESIPEITNWLFPPAHVQTSKNRLERVPEVNIEYPVHHPSLYHFWNNYYYHSDRDYVVIQGHPDSWDDRRFAEFTGITSYLKTLGVDIVLPRNSGN